MLTRTGTIDAGRGCPFNCSFCTIIHVQGRKMRARSPAHILTQIRENYHLEGQKGIRHYFFTDDNFTRNPHWEKIFDGLIRMHEVEGMEIDFMMQVDTHHATVPHPKMSADEWRRAFHDAWQEFYSFERMRRSLLRQNPHTYWAVLLTRARRIPAEAELEPA